MGVSGLHHLLLVLLAGPAQRARGVHGTLWWADLCFRTRTFLKQKHNPEVKLDPNNLICESVPFKKGAKPPGTLGERSTVRRTTSPGDIHQH